MKNIYLLNDTQIQGVQSFPQITISYLPVSIDFSSYDGIIFTSKNAIKAIEHLSSQWRNLPIYCISKESEKYALKCGAKNLYVSSKNYGDKFAYELLEIIKDKKVVFLGAINLASNIIDILNTNNVICEHIPVYETQCKEYKQKMILPKNSIIIFSSPSTIDCFLKNSSWDKSFKAIAIGKTTAKHFPEYINPIISKSTSITECIHLANEIQKSIKC